MKLVRYGEPGAERPGLIDADGAVRDLSGRVSDIAREALTHANLARLAALDPYELPKVDGQPRFGACVGDPSKVICIGLNFRDHAKESNLPEPAEPVVFFKSSTALVGCNDDVWLPPGSQKSDWEVELAVVIGDRARYVDEAKALDHVAGFCIMNDLSEREYQLERGGQWVKGKSCDTFGPLGPWLVTKDEVDYRALAMTLDVNGRRFQNGTTAEMIFTVPKIVSYLSQFVTLLPGDVISTGTPAGVGLGQKPPLYLKAGDVMELAIAGLGSQRQRVVPDPRFA